MIHFDTSGKVYRGETHIRTITAREAVKDYDKVCDALDVAVAALREIDGHAGCLRMVADTEPEKDALALLNNIARHALRQIDATAADDK